jgi:hypothetical protein
VLSTSVEAFAEQDQSGGDRHESHHHGEEQDFFQFILDYLYQVFYKGNEFHEEE